MNVDTPTKYISLYSGAGGLDLGFRLANPDARCVAYVERDAEACALLVDHMQTGQLDDAPLWSDSGTFDGRPWRGKVDFVIGGFPCQPYSAAGKRLGTEDERWLWPHIQRIARDVEPRGIFLENVPGLFHGGIEHVLSGLASLGFDAEWTSVRASDVGAPHRRERVFILAYRNGERRASAKYKVPGKRIGAYAGRESRGMADTSSSAARIPQTRRPDGANTAGAGDELVDTGHYARSAEQRNQHEESDTRPRQPGESMAHPISERGRGRDAEGRYATDAFPPGPGGDWSNIDPRYWPAVKSEVRGMANGLALGLARAGQLRLAGNGVVPRQAAFAFRELLGRLN